MNISKTSSRSSASLLLLAFTGLALNSAPALAADPPHDTQAQMQAVLGATTGGGPATCDEAHLALQSRDSVSPIEFQTLVRRFILGTPGSGASRTQAAALNATTISPAVPAARLDARTYAEAQRQVQRTLQGGAG
jgi:hypothetical protein